MKQIALALLLATAAHASPFRYSRAVTPGAKGPNRLEADVTLIAGSQPDLRDVRLFDAQNREVGYLLVPPELNEPLWLGGRILPIASTKNTSGFEVDLGRATNVDRLKLEGIAAPFLKHATLEGSGDRAHWTLLADATVFELPDEKLRNLEIEFAAGEYRYLRVTWDDRASARVSGNIKPSARIHDSATPPASLWAHLQFQERASEPGKSRYRLELPGPHLPVTSIEVADASGGDVFRNAQITEPRFDNGQVTPVPLGSGTLRRAQREGAVASEMEIPVATPAGRELHLVIDNGNNPPLRVTQVRARLAPQPWIYFESPDGAPLELRYGNDSLSAPAYDVEASRPYVHERKTAIAKVATAPGLDYIIDRPGAPIPLGGPIDREQFRVSRKIQQGPVGLSVLLLDADALANSLTLADIRIADESGHQVPYIVERRAEPWPVKLKIPERASEGKLSIYRFALPYDTWPAGTRFVLTTGVRVFEREVTLRGAGDDHRNRQPVILGTAMWRTSDPELLPPPLSFDVPMFGARAIELVVDEGDNAPLSIDSAQLLFPSSALRFYNPGTQLFLLYGNRQASAPRYDLALLAPRLFGQTARELGMAPAGATAAPDEESRARKFFWIGIAVAAIVLIVMLVRLLKPVGGGEEPGSLG
ncbi:MAG TPA: DUF3999 family protein [Thermoanaerobaculia bacterium]|nr:DUF3999 family protein [Thermoanaerobaculia bacterium]